MIRQKLEFQCLGVDTGPCKGGAIYNAAHCTRAKRARRRASGQRGGNINRGGWSESEAESWEALEDDHEYVAYRTPHTRQRKIGGKTMERYEVARIQIERTLPDFQIGGARNPASAHHFSSDLRPWVNAGLCVIVNLESAVIRLNIICLRRGRQAQSGEERSVTFYVYSRGRKTAHGVRAQTGNTGGTTAAEQ